MGKNFTIIFSVLLCLAATHSAPGTVSVKPDPVTSTPVVLWHGMGDSCCNPFSMGYVAKHIETKLPGIHVHSLMIGDNVVQDTENGFFLNINKQIELACDRIRSDPLLQDGYHAMGFSQGGLFFRGLAQRCPTPRIHSLISIGGPQQGVYGLPKCLGENHVLCDYVRRLLNYGAYVGWIQRLLVQAQYWHDPLAEKKFEEKSIFLADINNEGGMRNQTYKKNLVKLEQLVLVKFAQDTVVDPKGSEWFSWFQPGSGSEMLPMNQTELYQQDWIGLKTLDLEGRLHLLQVEGDHLHLDQETFDMIIDKYL